MAYDAEHGGVLLFGLADNQTWAWDGSNWIQQSPTNSPPLRYSASMAHNPQNRQVVLFGGGDVIGANTGETWEWSGTNWAQRFPASSPSARSRHAMVEDSARGNIVLFGGMTDSGAVGDTWVTAGAPKPAYNVCLLYDPTKAVKSGATIPIKLQLCDGTGNNVSSSVVTVHATSFTQVSTLMSGPVQVAGNANPNNDFRFDSTLGNTGGYILNFKTTGLATGTYSLKFTAGADPTTHSAPFQVR